MPALRIIPPPEPPLFAAAMWFAPERSAPTGIAPVAAAGPPRALEHRAPAFWLVASCGRAPAAARRQTVPSNLHLSLDERVCRCYVRLARPFLLDVAVLTLSRAASPGRPSGLASVQLPGRRIAPGGPDTHTVTQVGEL